MHDILCSPCSWQKAWPARTAASSPTSVDRAPSRSRSPDAPQRRARRTQTRAGATQGRAARCTSWRRCTQRAGDSRRAGARAASRLSSKHWHRWTWTRTTRAAYGAGSGITVVQFHIKIKIYTSIAKQKVKRNRYETKTKAFTTKKTSLTTRTSKQYKISPSETYPTIILLLYYYYRII